MSLDKIHRSMLPEAAFRIGRKNAFINGNFDIWQRATSLSSGSGTRYAADRFFTTSVGSTYTTALTNFASGQIEVPNNPMYYFRNTISTVAGVGNYVNVQQKIENVRTYSGKKATLSFYAKADAAKNIALELIQSFGSGGSPSADVSTGPVLVSLTNSWKKYVITFDVPSIAGKTIGTAGDNLSVCWWVEAGSNFAARTANIGQQSITFDLSQVQFEDGEYSTDFELNSLQSEMNLCMRYYESMDLMFCYNNAGGSVGTDVKIQSPFRSLKRAIPTVTYTITSGGGTVVAAVTATQSIVAANFTAGNINNFAVTAFCTAEL